MLDLIKVIQVSKVYQDRNGNDYKEIFFETYLEPTEELKYKIPVLTAKANFWKSSANPLINSLIYNSEVGDIWLGKIVSRNFYLDKKSSDRIISVTLPVIGDTQEPENFKACADAMFERVRDMKKTANAEVEDYLKSSIQDLGTTKKDPSIPKNPPFPLLGGIFTDEDNED